MEPKIENFFRRHHLMTIATNDDSGVWCANVFYVYDNNRLIFFSSPSTRHIKSALANSQVAVSIALVSKVIARLQGAQITGRFVAQDNQQYRPLFLSKFPVAALWNEDIWSIEIETVKFTDNTLGFGKKLYFPPKADGGSVE